MTVLKVTHTLDIPQEPNDLIQLNLEFIDKSTIRGRLIGNGKVNNLIVLKSKVDAVTFYLSKEPEELAGMFDQVGFTSNGIDGDWLVERLLAKRQAMVELDEPEALDAQIKRLTVVNNLMALHAVGSDVMNRLYGYNWVAEQSNDLIKRSKAWNDLVVRVAASQAALKASLSS